MFCDAQKEKKNTHPKIKKEDGKPSTVLPYYLINIKFENAGFQATVNAGPFSGLSSLGSLVFTFVHLTIYNIR